ncbi:BID domain-containing T4SS effector, partial [Bartonella tribocorum]
YEIVNLSTGETEFQHRENPLYDTQSGSTQDVQRPQKPDEHLYAELDFGTNSERPPHKPLESVYATVGIGAEGGQEHLKQGDLTHESTGAGRTTPPPRTRKGTIMAKIVQHQNFQHSVKEIQNLCQIVYGNQHALNKQLSKILDDPRDGERILWELTENPESPGKFAGRTIFGVKSSSRKQAQSEFRHLCSSLDKCIFQAEKLYQYFARAYDEERGHLKEKSPEQHERERHRHHSQERDQGSPEQSAQRRQGPKTDKGVAFSM